MKLVHVVTVIPLTYGSSSFVLRETTTAGTKVLECAPHLTSKADSDSVILTECYLNTTSFCQSFQNSTGICATLECLRSVMSSH